VVEEAMRWDPPGQHATFRYTTEDTSVGDVVIPAYAQVIVSLAAANRDPALVPDPDRLDITRDARHHVAFGFGVHQCLGQPLARIELQVVYSTLYKRIPTLKPATDLEQVPFKHDGAVYGVYELPVTW
jgi:cytochrome P450